MTTQAQEGRVPELTLGWRLKMALGEMKRSDMADALGVDPGTISRWCSDKGAPPKRVYITQWALLTGVPPEWLETGRTADRTPPTPPRPRADADALARLTEQKRSRTGRSDASRVTNAYPDAA